MNIANAENTGEYDGVNSLLSAVEPGPGIALVISSAARLVPERARLKSWPPGRNRCASLPATAHAKQGKRRHRRAGQPVVQLLDGVTGIDRPDDILRKLPEDQQHLILDWREEFSYCEVIRKIAAPPHDGFGLDVHYTSLRRFFMKRFPERYVQERNSGPRPVANASSDEAVSPFTSASDS